MCIESLLAKTVSLNFTFFIVYGVLVRIFLQQII